MYDLAIIGAGAAGIAAAKQALKSGLKAVLIDKTQDAFGGTCVNSGCIPTKMFINGARQHKAWPDILAAKSEVLTRIKGPLSKYLLSQGLELIWGTASFADHDTLMVNETPLKAKNFLFACGSAPRLIFKGDNVIAAEDIFSLDRVPVKVLVVGGGYIGIEIASLFNAMGSDVTVVEKEDRILPGFETRIVNRYRIILETQGIKINTGKTISDYDLPSFDKVVLAAGRRPDTGALNLAACGVKTDDKGWIAVDKYFRTNVDNFYACGDATGKMMLAYVAEYQAALCVKNIAKGAIDALREPDYASLAVCVFGIPQLAHAGLTEAQAREKGIKCRVVCSNFLKFSSTYVYGDNDGYARIIIDDNDTVIGADIISHAAAELIGILAVAIASGITVKKLRDCLLPHPTLSEIIPLMLRDAG